MLEPGRSVGVAVSGGADSTALLDVLAGLAAEWRWRLVVLHLNHGLRGSESDGDERFVREMASSQRLECVVERVDVAAGGGNIEDAGRRARREFFRRAMTSASLDRVAVGHTRSDQAETLMFRLLRGSGTTGLAGIWPVGEDGVVRPLIEISRDEVIGHLRDRGLAWREDSSNEDPRFARNRIRHMLLPALRRDWNPNLDAALGHLAEVCRDEEVYWRDEADRWIAAHATVRGAVLILPVEALNRLPVAARRRVLRETAARARVERQPLDFAHIEALVKLAGRSEGTGRVALPGVVGWRSFDWLRLAQEAPDQRGFGMVLPVPGEVPLPDGTRLRVSRKRLKENYPYNEDGVVLDSERASGRLEVRSWAPGAAFQPAGHSQNVTLKKLFQRGRVPSWERAGWPMIKQGETVIWVRRFGGAEGYLATSATRTGLVVKDTEEMREP